MKLQNSRESFTGECTHFCTRYESDYLLTDPERPPIDGIIDAGLVCVDSDFGSDRRTLRRLSCIYGRAQSYLGA